MEYLTGVQNEENLTGVFMEAINKVHTVNVLRAYELDYINDSELDYIREYCNQSVKDGLMTITFKGKPILELLEWEDTSTDFKYRFI